MAQTKQLLQQVLVIYLTICLVVLLSLMKVDSVDASSIPLDESGNMLQQQEQQQIDNNVLEHNYILDQAKQKFTAEIANNPNILVDGDNDIEKEKSFNEDQLNLGYRFKPVAMVKKAPGGFVGMRGKKVYYDDENNSENDNGITFNPSWNQLQNSEDDYNWDGYTKPNVRRYKKASTTFYGVRGKKFTTMNGVNSNNDNPGWHDFLQKLEEERVRNAILQDFVERLAGSKSDLTNDMAKRAPTGFTGVRGKRPSIDNYEIETLTKRGLGNNAFVGVRGKKDVSHQTFKRSLAGAESLPGRNGKRQRFTDFNNKFVAVRGKKSSFEDMKSLNSANNNRSPTATVSLLYDKRTPNGVFGVREKRPLTSDDLQ